MEITGPLDRNMQLLAKVLDLRAEKQQVIAANIANSETPGYAPASFEFETALNQALGAGNNLALSRSDPGHLPLAIHDLRGIRGTISYSPDTTGIGDENGVSVDQEMLALSENQLLYEAAAQLLKKKMGMISYVITGGQ